MNANLIRFALLFVPALLWGCGGKEAAHDHDHDHGHEHGEADGGHSHEEGKDDHDHEEEDDHEHGKERHALGEQKAGVWSVTAEQADDVTAGGETVFYVSLAGGPRPAAVRLWVGDESASASVRALGEWIEETRAHAHVEIPKTLGAADRFWVEIEDAQGALLKVGFDLAAGTVKAAEATPAP